MTNYKARFHKNIVILMGKRQIKHKVPILCPNHEENKSSHSVIKNGKDTSTKANHQQYLCKKCHRSFYAHTSKYFCDMQEQIPQHLKEIFNGGNISVKNLAAYFHLPNHIATALMKSLITQMNQNCWDYTPFNQKTRKGQTMIVDETFLKIDGKDWYLVFVITEYQEIMGFAIIPNREYETISPLLFKCAERLEGGLKFLITDGLWTYKKFARLYGSDITHVRHIHKPPFGRLEIDVYHYDHGVVYHTNLQGKNDIFTKGRNFKMEVRMKKKYTDNFRKALKVPIHEYSPEAICSELWLWSHTKITKRKFFPNKKEFIVANGHFSVSLRKGRVKVSEAFLRFLAAKLEELLPIFAFKHITTNLIENLNLIVQKCIAFGVKRNYDYWHAMVFVWCAIRDEPKILNSITRGIRVPKQSLRQMLPYLLKVRC